MFRSFLSYIWFILRRKILSVLIIRGLCVCILQSQETFLAGTDLDNVFNIVNEDFNEEPGVWASGADGLLHLPL